MLHSYKKILYSFLFLLTVANFTNAQTLLNEGFDGATFPPTGWSVTDNGTAYGVAAGPWQRSITNTAGPAANCTGTASAGVAYSRWSVSGATRQAWLITPALSVPASSSTTLTFCDREQFASLFNSTFEVRVSTTTNTPASFTTTVFTRGENNLTTYNQRTVNLSAYAGQTIYLAFVHINNDGDSWYVDNVIVTSVVNPPEINVLGTDNSSIASGTVTTSVANGTDFGAIPVATTPTVDRTFTIENTGTGNLNITGAVTSNNANFTILSQPSSPVAPSSNTTFTVRFAPSGPGSFNSTISIPNNDSDENPYTFRVSGTATAPQIAVRGLGNTIPNNKFLSTSTDGTFLGVGSVTSTFNIRNSGDEPLSVSGVSILGGSSSFSVGGAPTSIPAGEDRDFTVSFNPANGGAQDTIAISSNAANFPLFRFVVSAGAPVVASLPENLADGDVAISPNPSLGNFNIKIGGAKYTSVKAVVYDMSGRQVKSLDVPQFNGSMDLDLKNVEKGVYVLMLETGGEKVARKLIKQ